MYHVKPLPILNTFFELVFFMRLPFSVTSATMNVCALIDNVLQVKTNLGCNINDVIITGKLFSEM